MSTVPLRRNRRSAIRHSNREADSEIALLSAEEKSVRDQITDLERFIVKAPARAQRAEIARHERLNTLPPPDEFLPDYPEGHHADGTDAPPARLTHAQSAILRKHRRMNLAVFVAVSLAVAAFGLWIAENL